MNRYWSVLDRTRWNEKKEQGKGVWQKSWSWLSLCHSIIWQLKHVSAHTRSNSIVLNLLFMRKGDLLPCDTDGWMWTLERSGAEEKLCPPLIFTDEEAEPCGGWSTCWGCGSASTTITPSWSHSAESSVVKEHEGPPGVDTESLSGAQRVKNVSSSNREYSELRGLLLLDLCCVLELAGVLVSGTLSWTATILLGSCEVTGVDWGAADWGRVGYISRGEMQ